MNTNTHKQHMYTKHIYKYVIVVSKFLCTSLCVRCVCFISTHFDASIPKEIVIHKESHSQKNSPVTDMK